MATKMLIDATHPEETRVVVVKDGKVEEFDFEAANRRQLRGNIYLAKVTRVEPSLQAAFVDYGGNRHGFLAFSEIHPDYYQIPHADRQALIEEDEAHRASDDPDDNGDTPGRNSKSGDEDDSDGQTGDSPEEAAKADSGTESAEKSDDSADDDSRIAIEDVSSEEDSVESIGGDDAMEEVPARKSRPRRSYKIQEVIKKRQVLLVQVVKEERGNKGAALTTYLSLAGRYSVLMPNTARGGGISRKIVNATDRRRLKEIAGELDVPEGMGVILRTAGASRTKSEIKRDFEYLLRLWENVRELTLKSVAPTLVYEEGSLVKRAIRDLYTKDIDQILVAGDQAYREAKDFMRMLISSHAKNVQPYREPEPIFAKNRVEAQLDGMFSPQVTLKSGGYIVLNQTEALVSIDVNSGRSTREHSIEDTALKTNLEASDEVARQLRLRDLAGLIVIDFIDMEEKRNNRSVERRLKDALRHDRARIQVGRISHFGLLEMSRQRIRAGVLESTMQQCPHCEGTGHIRSIESVALHVLRTIEAELLKGKPTDLSIRTRTAVALYVLNQKRTHLRELEDRFSVVIAIDADDSVGGSSVEIERGETASGPSREQAVKPITAHSEEFEAAEVEDEVEDTREEAAAATDGPPKRKRRRRRKRGSSGEGTPETADASGQDQAAEAADADAEAADGSSESADGEAETTEGGEAAGDTGAPSSSKRRRGRRGGRRHRGGSSGETSTQAADVPSEQPDVVAPSSWEPTLVAAAAAGDATGDGETPDVTSDAAAETAAEPAEAQAGETASADESPVAETAAEDAAPVAEEAAEEAPAERPAPRKRAPRRSRAKAAEPAESASSESASSAEKANGADPAATATGASDETPNAGGATRAEPEAEPIEVAEAPALTAEPEAPSQDASETPPVPEPAAPEPAAAESAPEEDAQTPEPVSDEPASPPRRGWWRRRSQTAGE